MTRKLEGPSASHLAGTDHLGRGPPLLPAAWGPHGARPGPSSVSGSIALAVIAGGLSGYFGGTVDLLTNAVSNVLLTVPGLILTLAILGVLGTGQLSLLLALIGADWAGQGRVVRGAVLEAREQGYVEAARVVGARRPLPPGAPHPAYVTSTLAVLATLDLAGVVLTGQRLSFLGIGVQPPQADWGTMLSDSRPSPAATPA